MTTAPGFDPADDTFGSYSDAIAALRHLALIDGAAPHERETVDLHLLTALSEREAACPRNR